jgi:hypothetical protein
VRAVLRLLRIKHREEDAMAAENLATASSPSMKESRSSDLQDYSLDDNADGLCVEGDDKMVKREAGYVEERFRVDRRRLEQMIQGGQLTDP